jgi:hypothetical protein
VSGTSAFEAGRAPPLHVAQQNGRPAEKGRAWQEATLPDTVTLPHSKTITRTPHSPDNRASSRGPVLGDELPSTCLRLGRPCSRRGGNGRGGCAAARG